MFDECFRPVIWHLLCGTLSALCGCTNISFINSAPPVCFHWTWKRLITILTFDILTVLWTWDLKMIYYICIFKLPVDSLKNKIQLSFIIQAKSPASEVIKMILTKQIIFYCTSYLTSSGFSSCFYTKAVAMVKVTFVLSHRVVMEFEAEIKFWSEGKAHISLSFKILKAVVLVALLSPSEEEEHVAAASMKSELGATWRRRGLKRSAATGGGVFGADLGAACTLSTGTNKKIPVKFSCRTLLRAVPLTWGMWRRYDKTCNSSRRRRASVCDGGGCEVCARPGGSHGDSEVNVDRFAWLLTSEQRRTGTDPQRRMKEKLWGRKQRAHEEEDVVFDSEKLQISNSRFTFRGQSSLGWTRPLTLQGIKPSD